MIRIITANIGRGNVMGKRAVVQVVKRKPDVVCLQEVRDIRIRFLNKLGYKTGQAEDFEAKKIKKTGYVATGVKNKETIVSIEKGRYFEDKVTSLWVRFFRRKVLEHHESLITTVKYKGKVLRIVNVHLSTGCRPMIRIVQLERLLKKYANERTIFCGDLNIAGTFSYKLLAGWASGYRLTDYFYDERGEANKLIEQYKLQNPFAKKRTTRYPVKAQFDHILVPHGIEIVAQKQFKIALSDHWALSVDLEFV